MTQDSILNFSKVTLKGMSAFSYFSLDACFFLLITGSCVWFCVCVATVQLPGNANSREPALQVMFCCHRESKDITAKAQSLLNGWVDRMIYLLPICVQNYHRMINYTLDCIWKNSFYFLYGRRIVFFHKQKQHLMSAPTPTQASALFKTLRNPVSLQ